MRPAKKYMAEHKTGLKNLKIVPYGARFEWMGHSSVFIYAPKGYLFPRGSSEGRIYLGWETLSEDMPGPWLYSLKSYIFKMVPK